MEKVLKEEVTRRDVTEAIIVSAAAAITVLSSGSVKAESEPEQRGLNVESAEGMGIVLKKIHKEHTESLRRKYGFGEDYSLKSDNVDRDINSLMRDVVSGFKVFSGEPDSNNMKRMIRKLWARGGEQLAKDISADVKSGNLSAADRFKLAITSALLEKEVVYNKGARSIIYQSTLLQGLYKGEGNFESERARLQCASGSMKSIMLALSLGKEHPEILKEIEGVGKLVIVPSAIGPHLQWGIWTEGKNGGGKLNLYEATAQGVASATIIGENARDLKEKLGEFKIQAILDARDSLKAHLISKNGNSMHIKKYYEDDIPNQTDITIPEGDLVMQSSRANSLTPISMKKLIQKTTAPKATATDASSMAVE